MKTRTIRQMAVACALSLMTATAFITPTLAAPLAVSGPNVPASPPVAANYRGIAYVGNPYDARVRACASTACKAVGIAKYGVRVHVDYSVGGWSHVGKGRWIATRLLTRIMPCKS